MTKRVIRKSTRGPEVLHHRPFLGVQRGQSRHQGAAQFVWRYRRQFHRLGVVDFKLPFGASLPPWIRIVFESLRAHPRAWRVQEFAATGGITYRVYWRGWLKNRRVANDDGARAGG
jgi:hypothetical protein